jgi:hypothetical protein
MAQYLGDGLLIYFGWPQAHETAQDFGEQPLTLVRQVDTPTTFLVAHCAIGITLWWIGNFVLARTHLEQALSFDASQARARGTVGDAAFARVATRPPAPGDSARAYDEAQLSFIA